MNSSKLTNKKRAILISAAVLSSTLFIFQNPDIIQNIRSKIGYPSNNREDNAININDIVQYRWDIGPPSHIIKLRIPANYVSNHDKLFRKLLGSDYPDPNVTGPSISTIFLKALLPDFSPLTIENERDFTVRPQDKAVNIKILNLSKSKYHGDELINELFETFKETTRKIYAAQYSTDLMPKSDWFGLKRIGPTVDYRKHSNDPGIYDYYFSPQRPIKTFMTCKPLEVIDSEDDPSWSARSFCQHYFYSPSLNAEVSLFYRRKYASDWRNIEQKLEKILESFKQTDR